LIHLLYMSTATAPLDASGLGLLIDRAREFNAAHDVTGILLRCNTHYFQVLEGERQEVDGLYARIERDARHTRVTLLTYGPLARREYEGWSMSLAESTPREFGEATGLTQPLDRTTPRMAIDETTLAPNIFRALHRNRHWRIQGEPRV
jgi:hypothetical protein